MVLDRMIFDQSVCTDLSQSCQKEWLETNGLGGYASSTIAGMSTRRYHGLLVAALQPPSSRLLLLSKVEERLLVDGQPHELSTNQYPGTVYPEGFLLQREFRLDPWPKWLFAVEDVVLEKSVFMIHGENSTVLLYRILQGGHRDLHLELRPLIAYRDHSGLAQANNNINREVLKEDDGVSLRPYEGLPCLFLSHSSAEIFGGSGWYYRLEYQHERERGSGFHEDLFNPCCLRFQLETGNAALIASTQPHDARKVDELAAREAKRRAAVTSCSDCTDPFVRSLSIAADQFVVSKDAAMRTILAGYPWFSDWGRDAMISIPGLTLVTKRYEDARIILQTFADYCDQGMIPNYFDDRTGTPTYNSADATLWFFHAAREFVRHTNDYSFARRLYVKLTEILRWHLQGTRFNIKVDRDGLLSCGEPGITWMDVKLVDRAVTPRVGKPVEIQALWYNALRILEHFAEEFGDIRQRDDCSALAACATESFNRMFWNPQAECLFDCITEGTPDPSMRPNQILAVSLPFSMLSESRMSSVVNAVTRELLTSYGLRSLSPADPLYHGNYAGNAWQQDEAYHQGTVWPWLLGPYITARMRVSGGSPEACTELKALLSNLKDHLKDGGLGSISEVFDGDPPHAPGGCIAQAWSVAEILRVLIEVLPG